MFIKLNLDYFKPLIGKKCIIQQNMTRPLQFYSRNGINAEIIPSWRCELPLHVDGNSGAPLSKAIVRYNNLIFRSPFQPNVSTHNHDWILLVHLHLDPPPTFHWSFERPQTNSTGAPILKLPRCKNPVQITIKPSQNSCYFVRTDEYPKANKLISYRGNPLCNTSIHFRVNQSHGFDLFALIEKFSWLNPKLIFKRTSLCLIDCLNKASTQSANLARIRTETKD